MRKVLSLSLDGKTIKRVRAQSKQLGFDSVSQYVRQLIDWQDGAITEGELLAEFKRAQKEYASGKTVKADSLADLL